MINAPLALEALASRPARSLASRVASLGALVALSSLASSAHALPVGHEGDGARQRKATALPATGPNAVDFTAVVALSNCSGSLVRFTGSKPEDKAHVLTNGHCIEGGFLGAGEVVVDRASSRSFDLLTSDGQGSKGTLTASKLAYATMTDTDVGFYELTSTYKEIKDTYGVDALVLSDHQVDVAAPIRVVSGYWRTIYSCTVDGFAHQLHEADWVWNDSIRYSEPGCEVIGGTSGSPVVHADSHEIIGVNNTINESGESCTLDNPCEVDDKGNVTIHRNVGYAQNTYWFYGCLSDANQLDLTREGCKLPKPAAAP